MNAKLRLATIKDATWIAKVVMSSWQETYKGIINSEYLKNLSLKDSTARWKNNLSKREKTNFTFVCENEKNEIVGFIDWWIARENILNFHWEIYAIYILKNYQKHSLGHKLLKEFCLKLLEKNIKNMYVCVLKENNSKYFYKKMGWKYLKETSTKIWSQNLAEEIYVWNNFDDIL